VKNKNLIKSIVFILIFLIMLAILSKIFVKKNNKKVEDMQEKVAKGILAEPENTIDMLVVGDSESYSSFIPLEAWNDYGFTSFVCGTPRQNLPHMFDFIKETCEKQDLKVVLIESNAIFRRFTIDKSLTEFTYNVFPVFEGHDIWKHLSEQSLFGEVNFTNIQENKGFYYSRKVKKVKNNPGIVKTEASKRIAIENKLYMKTIKNYCESRGIKVILYSCPSIKNWSYEKHNGIKKLAKELDLDYIDLNLKNEEIKIDWSKDTRDRGDHLNFDGAKKITKYLGKYLFDKKIFVDHRNDEKYNDWNILYNKQDELLDQHGKK